jgi:pimeloyl-ACP methyl ester carboxylesterase
LAKPKLVKSFLCFAIVDIETLKNQSAELFDKTSSFTRQPNFAMIRMLLDSMKNLILVLLFVSVIYAANAAAQTKQFAVNYPHPVKYFDLTIENQLAQMAFMDVAPRESNGETVILFHGKNFNGYYWKDVVPMLTERGYRVVVPDQIGWGKSAKPKVYYSFHLLAANSKKLLDSLNVSKVNVIGHSMGGMLATRFALMYPETVNKLILENPIGLEDYRTFVPYTATEELFKQEMAGTVESYRNYQKTYYSIWKPEYEQFVTAQAEALSKPDFADTAFVNALTYQMIYEQPVVYEFKNIIPPTLLIIGQADRTVIGKARLSKEEQQRRGNYPMLGKQTSQAIRNSKLVELEGVGHIPHVQTLDKFKTAVMEFLKKP